MSPITKPALSPRVLEARFLARPALSVARALLGKYLVRRIGRRETAVMITETEAYVGPHDLACHASKGHTERTAVMFGPAGHWYVYFIYGIHWMLNAVTDEEGYPAAVLIRGGGSWDGPAKLTRGLEIDKRQNGRPISASTRLWVEDRHVKIPRGHILRTPRIGVDYAGPWATKPYRFLISPPLNLGPAARD